MRFHCKNDPPESASSAPGDDTWSSWDEEMAQSAEAALAARSTGACFPHHHHFASQDGWEPWAEDWEKDANHPGAEADEQKCSLSRDMILAQQLHDSAGWVSLRSLWNGSLPNWTQSGLENTQNDMVNKDLVTVNDVLTFEEEERKKKVHISTRYVGLHVFAMIWTVTARSTSQ